MPPDKKLNREQLEAVKHGKGPLLIIAGAGTGKTTVITERIKHLIVSELAKPSEILALTFTEKAAREMEERVDIALPYGFTQMWISTFHAFCDRILRAEALHIGLDPRFRLMTQSTNVQFLRNHLFEFDLDYFRPLGNPTKFVGGLVQHFSRLQDEDIAPSQYLDWANSKLKTQNSKLSDEERLETKKWLELAKAYKKYEELKVKEGVLDYGDLIVKTLSLFRQRPNILKNYQKQFKYVLVDEFQDTNFAQNAMAIMLAGKSKNITVCGDDDQSIYRFRGAAVSNILQFKKTYPKAKLVCLTKNYRSGQVILDKAHALVQFNNPDRLEAVEKIDKKLVSQTSDTGKIEFVHCDRVENEAEEVAKRIKLLITNSKLQIEYKDIAILVRANNHAEPFMRALSRAGIPFQFLGPGKLFKQPEVADLIAYLRVLNNFEDSVSLYRLLSIEAFDIPAQDVARIGNYARRVNLPLFDACEKIQEMLVSKKTKDRVTKLIELIKKHLKLARKETAGQLLYYFLQDTNLLEKYLHPDNVDAQKRAANISKLFDKLKSYEVENEDATVAKVVDWIDLATELGESPLATDSDWTNVNAVNILTVHSAKGLEFEVVFLVNLVSLRFPTIERREAIPIPEALIKEVLPQGDFHLEEERRLFYVGMTRAKSRLVFTAADYYSEGRREKKLSPFIFEALGEDAVAAEQKPSGEQLSFLDYSPVPRLSGSSAGTPQLPSLHIDYLSYSQIETFRICPLHYKLRYMYNIPTPPSASQSFGTSIHAALKEFYELTAQGEKASEKLIHTCLEDNWVKEGFTTKVHEEKFLEKGRVYLSGFLKEGFDPKSYPVVMEQSFTLPLGKTGKSVTVKPLKIGGKIDRVDVLADGSVEIIDYKTGASIPTQSEVDKNLQLSFYALAATSIPDKPFGRQPEEVKLSLYFLDEQEKISTVRTKQDLQKAIDEIFEVRDEIEKSNFACSGHMFCQNTCEYSLFCRSGT